MAHLSIDSLRKEFDEGSIIAVDDIDLDINEGEMIVVVGPSGCGKSTTLRCIAGLEIPSSGEIILEGEEITTLDPRKRNLSMVFQDYALYPHMTARQNMSFGLKMSTDLSLEEIDERVEEAASMMGIEDQLDQKPSELSGGQQQRVALGRAIVREPEVFLMDEPLSNLDAKLRDSMRTEIKRLQQEFNTTTIYVTHNQIEAMTMADRIVVMDAGEIQQVGTPLECYYQPNNVFVANFIGSPRINIFDVETTDGLDLTNSLFEATVTSPMELESGSYLLGIRPEDVILTKPGEGTVDATVVVSEPTGDQTQIQFDISGTEGRATVSGASKIKPDEKIGLLFPTDRIHLFDPDSGNAIIGRENIENESPLSTVKADSRA